MTCLIIFVLSATYFCFLPGDDNHDDDHDDVDDDFEEASIIHAA